MNLNLLLTNLETNARELEQQSQNPGNNGSEIKNRIARINEILQRARSNIDQYGPITPDMIRETFYNVAADSLGEKMRQRLIPKDDIAGSDAYVMLAIPALVILKIISSSKDINGVRLLNNRVLNENNCPEEFKPIYKGIVSPIQLNDRAERSVKERVNILTQEQFRQLELACVDNPENPLPENVAERGRLMALATYIKRAATTITQKEMFKNLVSDTLAVGLALGD